MSSAKNQDALLLFRYPDEDALVARIAPYMSPENDTLFRERQRVIQHHMDTVAQNGKGALERNHLGTVETVTNVGEHVYETFGTHHYLMNDRWQTLAAIEKTRVTLPIAAPLDRDDPRLRILTAIADCRTAVMDYEGGDLQMDFIALPQINDGYLTIGTTLGANYRAATEGTGEKATRRAREADAMRTSRQSLLRFVDNAVAAGVITPMREMPIQLVKKIPPIPFLE